MAPDGSFIQDVISLAGEEVQPGDTVFDPVNPLQHVTIPAGARFEEVRSVVMARGKKTFSRHPPLNELADRCADQLQRLPPGCLRFINPHRYKVSISSGLNDLRNRLMEEVQRGY
jgi:nicotinate phosphoribosyltransferase